MDQSKLLKAMQDPGFYPEQPPHVEIMETHVSTLFLTDRYVYKVKKPVHFGFLDFTELSSRKFFCEKELVLNQRLSSDVYLAVIPISQTDHGFAFGEQGTIVEYAVKMRRLPEQRMMLPLLQKGDIKEESIRRIALLLIGFHSRAHTDPEISIYGTPERISKNTEENFTQTRPFVGTSLSQEQYDRISGYTRNFIEWHKPLLRKRIDDKKIRDCHGDIRMEHICIEDEIVIFDCVEFNRRFRYSDVAADLAFLAMDLDFHKAHTLSRHLVRTYVDYTHDLDLLKLIRFYKCYRAYVRGKVDSFKGSDKNLAGKEREQALSQVWGYFALAESYAGERPFLVITSGLTGTGKSSVAEDLAHDLNASLFQSDRIRKEITGVPLEEHRFEPFSKGIYSEEISRKTYQTLLLSGEEELKKGRSVILDASFLRSEERKQAQGLAEKMGVPFFVVEVTCPEQEVRRRLALRLQKGGVPSDGRWEIYLAQKQIADPVTEVPTDRHLLIDTSQKENPVFEAEKSILLSVEA